MCLMCCIHPDEIALLSSSVCRSEHWSLTAVRL